ncbi:FtsK/SpoIIIE domain-containing protein [Streptomyces sp. NPDC048002]|uniref:FtsK/SpoIIIE domain-containing protein n=1 Tax=Streptomyces sp. NPDC048002 TaxID=3154344 RepID=UPI0033F9A10B
MQIRLTVVDPLGPPPATARGHATSCDVLVTAPAGTALAAVASALASTVSAGEGPVVVYAGAERLDGARCTLGDPPLVDGAVLSLGAPAEPEAHPEVDDAPTQLHVVAGPDAGGVHLLHGGRIHIGRSAEADVPLDDPDVSRLHCAVTVAEDGRVSVADLGSTNGTTLDGVRVGTSPVRLVPGALLRIGESALRLAPAGGPGARVPTVPDGEGHIRLSGAAHPRADAPPGPSGETRHAYGPAGWGAASTTPGAQEHGPVEPPVVPGQGGAPRIETRTAPPGAGVPGPRGGDTHGAGFPADRRGGDARGSDPGAGDARGSDPGAGDRPVDAGDVASAAYGPDGTGRAGAPPRGTDVPPAARRRGLSAWARRLTGGRAEQDPAVPEDHDGPGAESHPYSFSDAAHRLPDTWPDPAALLLASLGPGPRLWERGPDHPEALTVRLGTTDRAAPDGSGLLPAVPVTAGLREAGALGLAGPRARLAGLARSVIAQLAALHSPDTLEIVLISADRSRSLEERTAEWSWLGWLPQLRPAHGQDCRLLLAHDRDQATARTDELLRRLDDRTEHLPPPPAHRPSWAQDDPADPYPGPYTVVVVDGDPGGADVREAVARLASDGPRAGIHVVCLAETPPASPASPVADTYRAACAAAPSFRECGAVALLSGDVATALRLMRVARQEGAPDPAPVAPGTVATVDAVSLPWAERFARALAPLRPDGTGAERQARVSAPLPQAARLLDELGLARATPASLMARWADAADDTEALGGRACAVLGAGPRGPVTADLGADGPHLLIEGPAGSGRTELLRALVASLAAAERPDRLSMVLVDGRDGAGGEGLRVCTDVPHVTTHLAANDPVRMREFAQSLSAELKRRAELLGRSHFAEWHAGRLVSGRMVSQRTSVPPPAGVGGAADLDAPPSSTLRLRPAASRRQPEAAPPLPRLVVVVDDLDALVSPALGSPGRPAAGSVVRALEAVAREGERLGVHLVAAAGGDGRTAVSEPARRATLRVTLDAPATGPDEPAAGRARLAWADGRTVAFQAGRVTGRIPRTATLRPTVVALEWHRMGDPPARRPVRELGNGPTDLALLASALERAAREVSAAEVPSLL